MTEKVFELLPLLLEVHGKDCDCDQCNIYSLLEFKEHNHTIKGCAASLKEKLPKVIAPIFLQQQAFNAEVSYKMNGGEEKFGSWEVFLSKYLSVAILNALFGEGWEK